MLYLCSHAVFISKVARQCIRGVNTAVLSAGATKINFKAFETSLDIIFHRNIHNTKNAGEKLIHSCLAGEVILHAFIPARLLLMLLYPPGIEDAAAIKYKATTIPRNGRGVTAF